MIAAAIIVLRPDAEVETIGLDVLGEQIRHFDPQVVVSSRPNTVEPGGRMAWIELSIDSTRVSKVCVGGRYSESTNPTLEVLLRVIEDTEKLVQIEGECAGC